MHTQRKRYCFRLVNVIIATTLVVFKTQLLLLMLNGDDLYLFFRKANSTKLENKRLYKPMLHQFCIAINGVETRFLTPLLFKEMNDAVEIQLKYTDYLLNLITYQTIISADSL